MKRPEPSYERSLAFPSAGNTTATPASAPRIARLSATVAAAALGLHGIRLRSPEQLRGELVALGLLPA